MTLRLCALALVLAGCSDLPDLGTCGNGIVEADQGEACDGDVLGEDTCTDTCQLRCIDTPAGDYVSVPTFEPTEQYCPDARMTCALDGICRAPSGQFEATGALQSFDIKAGVAGDFDADGIDDLVGTSATQIVVRLGSTAAPFADGFVQGAPSADAPIAIYDRFPGSRAPDRSDIGLAIPTDGLALMTSNTEVFGPQLDTAFEVDAANLSHFLVRDPTLPNDAGPVPSEAVFGVAKHGTSELAVKRVAIAGTSHGEQPLVPCKPSPNQPVDLVSVAVAPDSSSFVVVGRGTGANVFACRYKAKTDNSGFDMQLIQQQVMGLEVAILAQLDNDPCLDLVTTNRVGGNPQLRVLLGAGPDCALTTPLGPFAIPDNVGALLGAGPIVPSGAPARDQLVFETGVFAVDTSGGNVFTRLAAPTSEINQWTTIGIVDLNGDGQLDVVAGRRGQDDVDIVRGGPVPNVYRADTTAQVIKVVDGDFDGDGVGDAALIESANNQQLLSILYGTREGVVGAPIVTSGVEELLGIARIHRAGWANTRAGSDGVDDLIVIRIDLTAPSTAGLLIGDAARQMTMPRLRTDRDPADPDDQTIGNVAIGPIDGKPIALTLRPTSDGANTALLLTHDLDDDVFSSTDPIPTSFRIDTLRQPAFITTFAPLIAALGVPPAATSIDQNSTVGLFGTDGTTCTATAPGRPFAVRSRDLDGDGRDEVLLEVVERGLDRDVHVVHVFDVASDGTAKCKLDESPPAAIESCVDVVRIDGQLVALCAPAGRFGLYRFADTGARDANPFVELDGEGLEILTGEFDGDGVADLAVRVRRAAELSVQFVRQCPSHDVRGCQ